MKSMCSKKRLGTCVVTRAGDVNDKETRAFENGVYIPNEGVDEVQMTLQWKRSPEGHFRIKFNDLCVRKRTKYIIQVS